MCRDPFGRLFVEGQDLSLVIVVVLADFGGDRIMQRQFGDAGLHMSGDNGAGVAIGLPLGEMGHHVGLRQRANGLEGQKLRVARAGADADQAPCLRHRAHSPGLASALTAAAVMAEPPNRPRTTAHGTAWEFSTSASLDSAAPTKPTGIPMMAAGLGAPSRSFSSR